jgi:hypothetical protein
VTCLFRFEIKKIIFKQKMSDEDFLNDGEEDEEEYE